MHSLVQLCKTSSVSEDSLECEKKFVVQVQMALERGIPAVSAVMGTQRLVFPSNVFDSSICTATGQGAPCNGDEGGPLTIEEEVRTQIGILSCE